MSTLPLVSPGPVATGLKIGLLGGSFNPAHDGHVYVSEVALKRLALDYVWWLVAPQNPLKSTGGMAPFAQRLDAARDLVHHPRILVSDLETRLHTRYTVDTVAAVLRHFPQMHFVWLMGSDNLEQFHRWRRWEAIAQMLPIAVITRPGSILAALKSKTARRFAAERGTTSRFAYRIPPALIVLDGPRSPLSATSIRAGRLVGPGPAW